MSSHSVSSRPVGMKMELKLNMSTLGFISCLGAIFKFRLNIAHVKLVSNMAYAASVGEYKPFSLIYKQVYMTC